MMRTRPGINWVCRTRHAIEMLAALAWLLTWGLGAMAEDRGNISTTDALPLPAEFSNIAPRAQWTASSTYAAVPGAGNLLDESPAELPYAFSTDVQDEPSVDIEFSTPAQIKRVVIFNRDCRGMEAVHNPPAILARAVPLSLSVSDDGQHWTPVWDSQEVQDQWTVTFTSPVRAQFLRLQVKNRTFLHLSKVQVFGVVEAPQPPTNLRIIAEAGDLQIGLDGQDRTYLFWRQAPDRSMRFETTLAGGKLSAAAYRVLAGGGAELTRQVAVGAHTASIVECFRPDGNSIAWTTEIQGQGDTWSVPIRTYLTWPALPATLCWAPWSDPRPEKAPRGWHDPLIPVPFASRTLVYGGPDPTVSSPGFSLPFFSILEGENGLSWQQAVEDFPINMQMRTTAWGDVTLDRMQQRITSHQPVRWRMRFVTHEADPRAALGSYVERHSEYFRPPNPRIWEIMGNGTYSSYRGEIDARKYARMGYLVNWRFPEYEYPYIGIFVPPVPRDDEVWVTDQGTTMSLREMQEGVARTRRQGFHLLSYFNVFEFGRDCKQEDPAPLVQSEQREDYWRNPNDMAWHVFRDALPYASPGRLYGAWKGGVVIDPAEASYSDHLLGMARQYLEKVPESDGLCIDRLDISAVFNTTRDDGVSWYQNSPARSLLTSWLAVMDRVGPVMHQADKVIVANPIRRRIEMMRHLDGFYDESGQNPLAFNLAAFLALRKPYVAWTQSIQDPTPDEFFQRHLYMGSFVTVPFREVSHTLPLSGPEVDRQFLDYGPLFDALRGRQWVLQAGVIRADGEGVKANVFEVPGGFVVPVGFAGQRASVTVRLQGLPWPEGVSQFRAESIRPGELAWAPLKSEERSGTIELEIPVVRGCAMARLLYAWLSPDARAFASWTAVEMGTTVESATLRYSLGMEQPDADSPEYTSPLSVANNTQVRVAAFLGPRQIGRTIAREYIQTPPAAPAIVPNGGVLNSETRIHICSLFPAESDVIRYTLDGRDPTTNDPPYTAAFGLADSATVKARVFAPDGAVGSVAEARFSQSPPPPPLPSIYLSDLPMVRGTTGFGDGPQQDLSITGQSITLAGRVHEKGVGVHSRSELEYDLKPDYRRFVAVVGVDDAMQDNPRASVVFKVFALKNPQSQQGPAALAEITPLYETPVLRAHDSWTINVEIPVGCQRIRLVVTEANDGNDSDHADWAAAGFLER